MSSNSQSSQYFSQEWNGLKPIYPAPSVPQLFIMPEVDLLITEGWAAVLPSIAPGRESNEMCYIFFGTILVRGLLLLFQLNSLFPCISRNFPQKSRIFPIFPARTTPLLQLFGIIDKKLSQFFFDAGSRLIFLLLFGMPPPRWCQFPRSCEWAWVGKLPVFTDRPKLWPPEVVRGLSPTKVVISFQMPLCEVVRGWVGEESSQWFVTDISPPPLTNEWGGGRIHVVLKSIYKIDQVGMQPACMWSCYQYVFLKYICASDSSSHANFWFPPKDPLIQCQHHHWPPEKKNPSKQGFFSL